MVFYEIRQLDSPLACALHPVVCFVGLPPEITQLRTALGISFSCLGHRILVYALGWVVRLIRRSLERD